MEGKETRFGIGQTSLFGAVTTAATTGSVDAMHDSLTPIGGLVPIAEMMLNNVFGGDGVGFINLITFAILTVFIVGMMIGRTPEFLGKKIEAREMKFVMLAHPLVADHHRVDPAGVERRALSCRTGAAPVVA
jgi:K+-transporting ATPase ATPase A chain